MPLDLEPIRARLNPVVGTDLTPKPSSLDEYYTTFSECGEEVLVWVRDEKRDVVPPLAVFIAHAPDDIAALLAEVEMLREEVAILTGPMLCDECDTLIGLGEE